LPGTRSRGSAATSSRATAWAGRCPRSRSSSIGASQRGAPPLR